MLLSLARLQLDFARPLREEVRGLFGAVTGIDEELIPKSNASDLSDVDTEDGVAKPRRGFRNVVAQVTNQTTLKGAHWCQVYVSGVLHEAFVVFSKISGTVKPYELAYVTATDTWALTEITNGGAALSLSDTYWRCVCYGDKAYFINPNDTNPVNSYTIGTANSWTPVKPPAAPSARPTLQYYLNKSGTFAYQTYFGTSGSYALTDVSETGTAIDETGASVTGQSVFLNIAGTGAFTITLNLVHGGAGQDLSYNDAFRLDLEIDTPGNAQIDFASIVASLTASGSQDLTTTVVQTRTDTSGRVTGVTLYCKFAGKTRSSWTSTTTMTLTGTVTARSGAALLKISPLTAGGVVDWGLDEWEYSYSDVNSTTTLESGLAPVLELNTQKLRGTLVLGQESFPLGSIPVMTMVNASDADTFRIYARKQVGQTERLHEKHFSPWRRVAEQADSTTTYTISTSPADFEALTEYAPAPFASASTQNGFVFKQSVCWLYPGGSNNVRFSRYNNPIAQASDSDAFRTDLGQDDDFRGINFTLAGANQDQPVCGLQVGDVALIFGSAGAYLVTDTENGLPFGFTPPKPVPGAPGIHGPEAFALFHDENGTPIVVYVAQGGESLWAVRIPTGVSLATLSAIEAFEFSSLIRGSMDQKAFGGSFLRDPEATHVYVNGKDDSLHVRYNTREVVFRRPDLKAGRRPWTFYSFNTGQYADQWQKFRCVLSSIGWLKFGFRLNGAVDEFEEANTKHPTTGDRYYVTLDGSGKTPSSTNTGTDVLTFSLPTGWSSGTPIVADATGGGLTAGQTRYWHALTSTTGTVHTNLADAQTGANKVNITASITATLTPLGPDDGSAFLADPYWTSQTFYGERRRVRKVKVDKKDEDDTVTVTVTSDRQASSAVDIGAGDRFAKFGPQQSGDRHKFKFTLSERHSGIRGFSTEEAPLSPARQR